MQSQAAGARIAVRNVGTGAERTTQTNERGVFIEPFIPRGYYEIQHAGSKR
jgi:hypothetical protein